MPDGRMRKERKSPGETGSWPYGASSGTGLRTEKKLPVFKTPAIVQNKIQRRKRGGIPRLRNATRAWRARSRLSRFSARKDSTPCRAEARRYKTDYKSDGGAAALEAQQNQIGAAADSEFAEQVGDMELDGALGNVQLAGDFLVGQIQEERFEDLLLTAAEIGHTLGLDAAGAAFEDGIHKA